jgi:hypothetical protein
MESHEPEGTKQERKKGKTKGEKNQIKKGAGVVIT